MAISHRDRPRLLAGRLSRPAVFGLAALLVLSYLSGAQASVRERDRIGEAWQTIRAEHFGTREIRDGAEVISLDAPDRAEDPAVVPITITDRRHATDAPPIRKLWLVIDNNPVPMSAAFEFGPASGAASLATRVRVNTYTYMRVIAETEDETLYMVKQYVKASGGCSAPIGRDPQKALEHMGEMRLRTVDTASDAAPDTQLMIRHPNITGLQMDQVTRLVWPEHFVDRITVEKNGVLVFDAAMTFSLSENPNLRFTTTDRRAGPLSVRVHDNKDNIFETTWQTDEAVATHPSEGSES